MSIRYDNCIDILYKIEPTPTIYSFYDAGKNGDAHALHLKFLDKFLKGSTLLGSAYSTFYNFYLINLIAHL